MDAETKRLLMIAILCLLVVAVTACITSPIR
jgi:hypothetical protein